MPVVRARFADLARAAHAHRPLRGPRRARDSRWARRALAACVLAGLAVAAEPAAPAEPVLTLDGALAKARQANRTLVVERARLAQVRTNLELAWSALFPTLAAQGKYTRNNIGVSFSGFGGPGSGTLVIQPENQLDGTIAFTAPLVVPAALAELEAVKSGVRSAEASYATAEAELLETVARAYFAAAIAEDVLGARRAHIDVARATVRNAETRFAAGTVTKVDVARAELALVRAEQAEREARFGREQAYRALRTLIQAASGFRVDGLPSSQAATTPRDLDAVLELRPEFRAAELWARSHVQRRRAHAWRWAPGLSAFGNARVFNYDTFARKRHAWAIGLQLDWVLFDGGARDALRHASAAQAREAEARAEALRDAIRDELADTSGLLATKHHAHEAAERSVALATETLALVRTQYETGNVTQLDLLEAQDGLVVANEILAQAHFDLAVADLKARRAAGTFPGK